MQMNPIKSTYLSMVMINSAMIAGPAVLAIIFWILVGDNKPEDSGEMGDMKLIFQIIVVGSLCMSYVVGKLMGGKQLELAKQAESLSKKLELYRSVNILKTALLEGSALAAMVFFFITYDQSFIYIGILILGYMIAIFPTQNKIAKDLELNDPMSRELTKALQA